MLIDFFGCLLIFKTITSSKNYFRTVTIRVKILDPDQDRHFVRPDLGPNCLLVRQQNVSLVAANSNEYLKYFNNSFPCS